MLVFKKEITPCQPLVGCIYFQLGFSLWPATTLLSFFFFNQQTILLRWPNNILKNKQNMRTQILYYMETWQPTILMHHNSVFWCHLLKALCVDKCIEAKEQDHSSFHNRNWAFFLSFKLCGTKQFQMWLCSACETRVFDMKAYGSLLSFDKSLASKKLTRPICGLPAMGDWARVHCHINHAECVPVNQINTFLSLCLHRGCLNYT